MKKKSMKNRKKKTTTCKAKRKIVHDSKGQIAKVIETPCIEPAISLSEPVVQLEIPLEVGVERADKILEEAVGKVEEAIEVITDSDRYPFDLKAWESSLDNQILATRDHLKMLRAMKHQLHPGFWRRLGRKLHICS